MRRVKEGIICCRSHCDRLAFVFGHMKWPGEWHHRAEGRGWVGNNMYFYITAGFGRDNPVRREAALEMPVLPNVRVIITWVSYV